MTGLLRRSLSALAGLALLLPSGLAAQTRFTLGNGMEVVVIEDHRAPVVVHMVWYRVGAADEARGESGIAHFLEHLMFKATEEMEAGEFSATVEAQGGQDNAFTSWDYTAYHQRVAADRLGLMMEMEADRMVNLRLDRSEWQPELQVVLEERSESLDTNPDALLREQMASLLFRRHPYGIPIIGQRDELAALDGEVATEFYRRHYAPNNAILIVAGDADPEEVRRLAEATYGQIAARDDIPERRRVTEMPQTAERRVTYRDARATRPYIARSYLVPNRQSGDQSEAAAFSMLAAILGGSAQTAVFEQALTYGEGITLSAWAGYNGTALDYGTFGIGAIPAEGVSLAEAEAGLDRAFATFLEEGVDPEQFERVRRQIRASEIYEQDDAAARARAIGAALTTGLTLDDATGWLAALQAVTPEDVMRAARALDRRASVTGWLLGEEE